MLTISRLIESLDSRRLLLPSALLCVLTLGPDADAGESAPETKISYGRDIQKILSEKCFQCHGRDPSSRKAKLRLDKPEHAFAVRPNGGPQPIVKGNPRESELIYRLITPDEDELMPPPDFEKPMTPGEIRLLEMWIEQGANYEGHWSFSPPVQPDLPKVDAKNWSKNPIDRFVFANLKANDLSPSPPAEKHTLIRRVSFDLTGLPPSPQMVEAFVTSEAPLEQALEEAVDALLRSPHYGEHLARYWLDAARYGDTHGLHLDNYREIWPYRDWVINAFNANMPFDQFTIEQLAGDLLPNPTLDQRIATGFSRCNVTTSEGGAIDDEYLAIYAKDRVATMTKVWMGLAADCASCHDHKFDPLTMKDFYQLAAFFRNTTQKAMDGNAKDTPPNVFVPARADRDRWNAISKELATVNQELEDRRKTAMPDFSLWQDKQDQQKPVSAEHTILRIPLDEGKGSSLTDADGTHFPIVDRAKWIDGLFGKALQFSGNSFVELGDLGDFERDQQFSFGAWLQSPGNVSGAAIARMDRDDGHRGWDLWMQNGRVAVHLIYNWPEDYFKVTTKSALKKGQWTHVFATYDGSSDPRGVTIYFDGVPQEVDIEGKSLTETIRTTTSLKLGRRSTGQGFKDGGMHDFRLYQTALTASEVQRLAKSEFIRDLAHIPEGKRSPQQQDTLLKFYLDDADAQYRKLKTRRKALNKERDQIKSRGADHACHAGKAGRSVCPRIETRRIRSAGRKGPFRHT